MDIQVVNSSGDFWKGTLPLLNSPPFKVSEKSVVILTDKKLRVGMSFPPAKKNKKQRLHMFNFKKCQEI